ncbi:type IV pilus assembly protein PilB [Archangium gephyra]|uniref:Type IV fimbrial assembly, ATPase PilB n=1 Tax=Archangium gephyra TaxID=48 RepID=A0AAC8QA33_9BACT|nr:ATPase [Archangium gephyra]AKJ03813.1 Type IV fimbrial assembly, ATPase PilB [Archangium gephyra]REG23592.1 type IV pilus assembly protein PilB [Archangium gephyra]
MAKRRLGELLRDDGLVDELQLRAALGFHNKWGVPLGQVVVDMGFCTAQQVLETLARQLLLPTVDLDAEVLDPRLADVLPARVAEECRVVPLRLEGPRDSVLVVATTAPADPPALDEVAHVSGKVRVVTLLATDAAISRAIDRLYHPHLLDARRPVEPIPLPEADEHLPLVTNRAECLMMGLVQDAATASTTVRSGSGLPVLVPLTEELPAHARLTERELPRVVAAKPAVEREPEVWVYGWGVQATEGLLKLLEDAGLRARVARTQDVRAASPHTVVLAPVQSVESVTRRGLQARLLLAGRAREEAQAWALGARGFLSGPLRADLLSQAVREQVLARPVEWRKAG